MITMSEPELGGVAEISAEFGEKRNVVSMWAARRESNGFPHPVTTLAMGPVYDMEAVRNWYASRPEPRNRPKATTS